MTVLVTGARGDVGAAVLAGLLAAGEPRLEEVDVDSYRAQLLTQLPGTIVERVLQDRGSVPQLPAELATDAVPEILGRPALTFAEWARDHAADFR